MIRYLLRRFFYAIPLLIGVNLITFGLFFIVNTPDDIAAVHLGQRYLTAEAITDWKQAHGYDNPLFYNAAASGVGRVTDTIFFEKSIRLFLFDFGVSDEGRDISHDVNERMWPSLALAIPALILGVLTNISFALLMVFFRHSYLDSIGVIVCVSLMSISGLFYIIGGQYLIANLLQIVPISGYEPGMQLIRFLMLPVLIGVLGGIGAGTRWYRTLFIEEMNKDYVRTAYAKGLSHSRVLFGHVLRNAMIPIVTGVVVLLPLLFLGSLLTESFFGIPGLGSYTIDAIQQQDFAIVRAMVFLGSILYLLGLILTDVVYTWVDPRVRLAE